MAKAPMSKNEDTIGSKLKSMLGITKSTSKTNPVTSSSNRYLNIELSAEKLREIGPENTILSHRLKALNEVSEVVSNKRLDEIALANVWHNISDLLKQSSTDIRHAAWNVVCSIIRGQYDQLHLLRAVFFEAIVFHSNYEDLQLRLKCFQLLSSDGKDLEHFELEVGPFLQIWMKEFLGSPHITEFMALLVNIVKYNAAHLDQQVLTSLVINTCAVARTTKLETGSAIELSLSLLNAIVCYSTVPLAALNHVIFCLCEVISLAQYYEQTWDLMRKLLGTHLGYVCIVMMCGLLKETTNMSESYAVLLRGAVLFIGMALWGAKRVNTLKNHPSSVLPFFLKVIDSHSGIIIYEVTVSVQRLVSKYGHEQLRITWDIILDIVEAVLKHIEDHPKCEPELITNIDGLMTSIENLYQKKQFNGSTDRFFDLIEICANRRSESSVGLLIKYRMEFVRQVSDNWQRQLIALSDKYYRHESRTKVRIFMLDALWDAVCNERRLSDEEIVDIVILPQLNQIMEDSDSEVKRRGFQLLVDVATACPNRFLEIVEILRQTLSQLRTIAGQQQVADLNSTEKLRKAIDDVQPFINGFINIFRTKLQSFPGPFLNLIFDVLTSYLTHHYETTALTLAGSSLSLPILSLLLDLRLDNVNRLGVTTSSSGTIYSCHIVSVEGKTDLLTPSVYQSPADMSLHADSGISHITMVPYAEAFHCIRLAVDKELDWLVLSRILETLPNLLKSKNIPVAASPDDIEKLCHRLCAMISDKSLGLPEHLTHRPTTLSKSSFHCFVLPVLASLVPHHACLSKSKQHEIIRCLDFGLVVKAARSCIEALTVASYEMQEVMVRQLPPVVLRLSQISANNSMAVPLLEFLSGLVHLPELYANFNHDQYMSVFAIALPYTNPFKYGHYVVSLAYHVITMWFLKCRLAFRKGFASFIIKGLMMNVKRQLDEMKTFQSHHSPGQSTQEVSSDRTRAMSMDDAARVRTKTAAAVARSNLPGVLDESAMAFHTELLETYIDMLARYTFSKCTNNPRRSPVATFLLQGGLSQSWLVQNKIVTVTTSGGATVGKAGLCDTCVGVARRFSGMRERAATQNAQSLVDKRRRHKSDAVRKTSFNEKPIVHHFTDDLRMYQRQASWTSNEDTEMASTNIAETNKALSNSDENIQSRRDDMMLKQSYDSHQQRINVVNNVLLGLPAKTTDQAGVFSHQCNCWCTQWAEVHIRRPTGNIAWMVRIENEQDPAELFPDFPFADISNLFLGDTDHMYMTRIDSSSLGENEYEHLLEEHFQSDDANNKDDKNTKDARKEIELSETEGHNVKKSAPSNDFQRTLDWLNMDKQPPVVAGQLKSDTSSILCTTNTQSVPEDKEFKFPLSHATNINDSMGLALTTGTVSILPIVDSQTSSSTAFETITAASSTASLLSSDTAAPTFASLHQCPDSGYELAHDIKPFPEKTDMKESILKLARDKIEDVKDGSKQVTLNERESVGVMASDKSQLKRTLEISDNKEERNRDRKLSSPEVKRSVSNVGPSKSSDSVSSHLPKHSQSVTSLHNKPSTTNKENLSGGVNPGFVLLQLYGSQFSQADDRPLALPQTETISRAVQMLDLIYPYETHKIGVLYVGLGQVTSETAILANRSGSSRYMNFIKGLGTLLRVRDCDPVMTYMGGLDLRDSDGPFAYAWHEEFMQVIFHVATLMPNKDTDPNCNAKKLHIGNDEVTIVYNDSGEDYRLSTIKGQFNYVNIVVRPLPYAMNIVTVQTKEGLKITELIGIAEPKVISDQYVSQLVRQMAIHANLASTIFRRQQMSPSDPYASNWLERLRQIKRLRAKVLKEQNVASNATPTNTEDFTDFV